MALYKTYDKVWTITIVRNKNMPTWNAYNSLISKVKEPTITQFLYFLVGNYVFKVNNRNTKSRYEICSNLTIKITEWRHWHRSGVFIVRTYFTPCFTVSLVNFEQLNAGLVISWSAYRLLKPVQCVKAASRNSNKKHAQFENNCNIKFTVLW